jgi:hypothetical protein
MAYNVLGWRRFCGCDKGIAKQFQQPQKCGGTKCHKGRKADWLFVEPEGANSARSANRVLNDEKPVHLRSLTTASNKFLDCVQTGVKRRRAASSGTKTINIFIIFFNYHYFFIISQQRPAHIAPVVCLKQTQNNKFSNKQLLC